MPRFPSPETLAGFFRRDWRDRVPVSELALLLDVPPEQARDVLRADGTEPAGDSVEWGEAASLLLDAWPRARILDALGPDLARSIPPAFRPARVCWRIPIFVLRAIRHQAALLQAPSLEDYVADVLFNEIQPSTVAALADDTAFLQAYRYPPVD
ncbi:MAG TPA: hypothetical protein VF432_26275 [Thermoanaerobaculia bacterium]